jgi:hypothetical protein
MDFREFLKIATAEREGAGWFRCVLRIRREGAKLCLNW